MTRSREVYYYDYTGAFGLGGLVGPPASDDYQLGRDARLLLGSKLSDRALRAALLAVPRNDSDVRGWLRTVTRECPADGPERDADETHALNRARPTVPESELRTLVRTEIQEATASASECVSPTTVAALLRVVEEVDADLGLRLFLRAAKEYGLPMEHEQYERLMRIGDALAYPTAAIFAGLNVRWPPLDPGRRDFAAVSLDCLGSQAPFMERIGRTRARPPTSCSGSSSTNRPSLLGHWPLCCSRTSGDSSTPHSPTPP
ncbi:hypothetical protein [Streptomyces sp. NPDC088864]|uniref:hypothetical protein n=1 Tax=Streptomyces sp. NPDC088864 TaxID=3365910 RepID=UPI0037F62699